MTPQVSLFLVSVTFLGGCFFEFAVFDGLSIHQEEFRLLGRMGIQIDSLVFLGAGAWIRSRRLNGRAQEKC